jgi:hypothetical protein
VNNLWKAEAVFDMPFPQKAYCSPLTRAMRTHVITFNDIVTDVATVVEVRHSLLFF